MEQNWAFEGVTFYFADVFFLHCLFGIALIGEASNGLLRLLEESKFVPVSYPPSLPSLPQALPGTVALLTSVPAVCIVCCGASGLGCTSRKCGFGRRRRRAEPMGQALTVFFAVRSPKLNTGLEMWFKGAMSKYNSTGERLLPFLILVKDM